jgi:hypothetical protein
MKSDRGANLGRVVNDELAMTQTATSAIFHWVLAPELLLARSTHSHMMGGFGQRPRSN